MCAVRLSIIIHIRGKGPLFVWCILPRVECLVREG